MPSGRWPACGWASSGRETLGRAFGEFALAGHEVVAVRATPERVEAMPKDGCSWPSVVGTQLGVDAGRAGEVLQALGELDPIQAPSRLSTRCSRPAFRRSRSRTASASTEKLLVSAGLPRAVQQVLTGDEVATYQPHPEPYRHVARTLGLPVEPLTLIAAHGWDVVGARAAGLSAIWVDRVERVWPFPTDAPPTASGLVVAAELALVGS